MPIRTKSSLSVPPKHPRRPAYSQSNENLPGACWETAGLGIKVQVIPSRTRDQRKTKGFTSGKLTLTYLLDPDQHGLLPENTVSRQSRDAGLGNAGIGEDAAGHGKMRPEWERAVRLVKDRVLW